MNSNKSDIYNIEFFGKGSEYFSIMIVNWLLTIITLGLYYPWAKAKKLRYIYGQTALNSERFHFSGTGKEMFLGYIKVILSFIILYAFVFMLIVYVPSLLGLPLLLFYLAFIVFIPFAIHGSLRYRLSRTSYRGIRFGYQGDRNKLLFNFIKWVFFTVITLGFYSWWLQMNIRKYTHENMRYGDVEFSNNCNGGDWLWLNFKGYLLTIITFGVYFFWWTAEVFNYYINNMKMTKGEKNTACYSIATGSGFFKLLVVNFLIIVFTLGFGTAWAEMRTQKFICDCIKIEGNINIDEIQQTQEEYNDAFGEDAMEFFDIDAI
jgi:uncharacterized membrane protein YjgN (DUF898 family)